MENFARTKQKVEVLFCKYSEFDLTKLNLGLNVCAFAARIVCGSGQNHRTPKHMSKPLDCQDLLIYFMCVLSPLRETNPPRNAKTLIWIPSQSRGIPPPSCFCLVVLSLSLLDLVYNSITSPFAWMPKSQNRNRGAFKSQ